MSKMSQLHAEISEQIALQESFKYEEEQPRIYKGKITKVYIGGDHNKKVYDVHFSTGKITITVDYPLGLRPGETLHFICDDQFNATMVKVDRPVTKLNKPHRKGVHAFITTIK